MNNQAEKYDDIKVRHDKLEDKHDALDQKIVEKFQQVMTTLARIEERLDAAVPKGGK